MKPFNKVPLSTDRDYYDPGELRHHFTGREALIHKVTEKLVQIPPVPALAFFGVGGAGKTYLLRYLQQEYSYHWQSTLQGYPCAFISFRSGYTSTSSQEALWQVREQLRRYSKKITFPRFDLLWGKIWERTYNMRISENPTLVPDEVGWFIELLQSVEQVPWIGDFVAVVNLGGRIFQRVRKEFATHYVLDWFKERIENPKGLGWKAALQVMDLAELTALLPVAFAADITDDTANLVKPYNRVLLFVDNYETLQEQLGEAFGQEARSFIQVLAEELIELRASVLLLIAGRDRLRWAELRRRDSTWVLNPTSSWAQDVTQIGPNGFASRFLEQYLVGNLSEADAMEYLLHRRHLNNPNLAQQICDFTNGYALALGVSADLVSESGTQATAELNILRSRILASDYEVLSEEWREEISDWLLERLLEQLKINRRVSLIGLVRAAAIPRWFDQSLLFHLVGDYTIPDQFRHLTHYSFVEQHKVDNAQVYQIHPVVRNLIRQTIGIDALRRKWEEASIEWFEMKTQHTKSDTKWHYQLEILYHRWFCDPSAAANELEFWFESLYPSQIGKCWELLDTATEFVGDLPLSIQAQLKLHEATLHLLTFSGPGKPGIHRQLSLKAAKVAARLAEQANEEVTIARAYLTIGQALGITHFIEWLDIMRKASIAAEKARDTVTLAESLLIRAHIETFTNSDYANFQFVDQSIRLFEQSGHPLRQMQAIWVKAWLGMRVEKWEITEAAFREAEQLNTHLQDSFWTAQMLQVRGEYYARRERWNEAAEILKEAKQKYEELPYTEGLCSATGWLGIAQCHLGKMDEGMILVRTALQIERDILDSREGAAKWLHYLGELYMKRNEYRGALHAFWLSELLREEQEHTELLKTKRKLLELREMDKALYERLEAEFDPHKSDFSQYSFLWGIGLFRKYVGNPILTPQSNGWESRSVLNPAAWTDGNRIYLFYRAENLQGASDEHVVSRIGLAISTDGIHFDRVPLPIIESTTTYETPAGCEDPRVIRIDDIFYMTYTASDGEVSRLSMAKSQDLHEWEKIGLIFPDQLWEQSFPYEYRRSLARGWSKAGALIPRQINGYYWMYFGDTHIWLAYSKDLRRWEIRDEPILSPRKGYFDSQLVEPGPPPILLPEGILLVYNAVDSNLRHTLGQALFSLEDPAKLVRRCTHPLLEPTAKDEIGGIIPNAIFSGGLLQFHGRHFLYYGMAGTKIGVAIAEVY